MSKESLMAVQDGPGSAAYSPALTAPDDVILYKTRKSRGASPADPSGDAPTVGDLMPPDPAIGGQVGQYNRLGYSDGFLAFRRRTAFTGRTLTVPNMGVHPAVGNVGFSTRSQRLRNRVAALATDYTPSSQEVAREITENM